MRSDDKRFGYNTDRKLRTTCLHAFALDFYRPQRSWAKVIFSQASVCPQGGGVSASVHAGIYPPRNRQTPPGPGRPPQPGTPPRADTPHHPPTPRTGRPPPDQAPPPGPGTTPLDQAPPQEQTSSPRKQTSAYGQRAAGTHPTGMHSC